MNEEIDEFDIDEFEDDLEELEAKKLYQSTGNRIFIWMIFNRLAKKSRPIPAWINEELIQVSERILAGTTSREAKDRTIVSVLGLSTKKDFALFNTWQNRDRLIFAEIDALYMAYEGDQPIGIHSLGKKSNRDRETDQELSPLEVIAKKHGTTYDTVREVYYKYKKKFEDS